MNIRFKIAETSKEFEEGKKLFRQYASSLGIDLSFQNFAHELNHIDRQYCKPRGSLLIAYDETQAIGCAGIREIDNDIAELKRMFVLKEYQGHGIGQKLLERVIEIAIKLGYKKIRLDTLPNMKQAQHLYRSFGFYDILPYRFNPIEGSIFMEKQLV